MTTREALAYVLSGATDSDAVLDLADDIIKGLASQGLVIVSEEPTAAMMAAVIDCPTIAKSCWVGMIDAAKN